MDPINPVLFQSSDFLILNKSSGVSVHNEKPSLQDQLKERGLTISHFVNRLDRETSGLVVATENASLVAALTEALANGRKIYRGIVKSPPQRADDKGAEWSWSDSLTDKAEGRRDPLGKKPDRIAAETLVRKVSGNEWFWDLQFELKTGRQHQIRKHAAHHGMPLVGDGRYGREALNTKVKDTYQISRMMLHAYQLEFTWLGQAQSFEAPLPAEFAGLLKSFR